MVDEDGSAEGVVTVSGLYAQNALQRSVSQLMDKKDEEAWEPHFRRLDSGLVRTAGFMLHLLLLEMLYFWLIYDFDCQFEGEEFVDSIKGFSTVRKEHTMFTDTNL